MTGRVDCRVLILRALGLGDGLTGVPALRGLRRAYPGAVLVLAAPRPIGEFLLGRGLVDELVPVPDLDAVPRMGWAARYGRPPELAVDLHGCGPESQLLLRTQVPGRLVSFRCAASGQTGGPVWDADEHEVARWCRLVHGLGGACGPDDLRLPAPARREPVVVLHPGADAGSRRWPWPRWARVAAELTGRGHRVVLTGGERERALCRRIATAAPGCVDLAGRLDLDRLAALVARAALVVCGDTGVAHLATAYATRSVLLFGPTPPHRWGPAIDQHLHRVLWHGHELSADRPWVGDPHGRAVDPALARIGVGEVVEAVSAALAGTPEV